MPERWRQVERIYSAVVARPEFERASALSELCAGDDALRSEVESLLAHEDAASTFLERPHSRGPTRRPAFSPFSRRSSAAGLDTTASWRRSSSSTGSKR